MKPVISIALLFFLLTITFAESSAQYSDHRGRKTDSLESVVAGWTREKLYSAPKEESDKILAAYKELMWGYLQINRERSMMFAGKALEFGMDRGYWYTAQDAARILGMHYYASQQWDSALFYYNKGLDIIRKMEDKETTEYSSKIYDQSTIDDAKSAYYGSLGNMYNMMDSIPLAMEYYKKAGEIFEKNGWKESNAILWYNMGETWLEEGDYKEAEDCYYKSLEYARASGDSLQISNPLKGLGALYLAQGKTSKALRCLEEADKYYSLHEDQEFRSRLETLDVMRKVLQQQKKQLRWIAIGSVCLALLALALLVIIRRMTILRHQKQGADQALVEALAELPETEDQGADLPLSPDGRTLQDAAEREESVMHKQDSKESKDVITLTDRERAILPLLAEGKTSPQIAEKLYLSVPTIKWYRKKLLIKFEATNTADLIYKAKEKGLI